MVIVGVVKHFAAFVATVEGVVAVAADGGAGGAGHGAIVARGLARGKPAAAVKNPSCQRAPVVTGSRAVMVEKQP